MIREADAKTVAAAVRERFEHTRAITLIGRLMLKAVFRGCPDEVVYWALVYAHFSGGQLTQKTDSELDEFAGQILRDFTPQH